MQQQPSHHRPTTMVESPRALEAIRAEILAHLKANLPALTGPYAVLTLEQLPNPLSAEMNDPHGLDAMKEAAAWTLVRDGIIIPGRSSNVRASGTVGFDSFPNFRITPYGRALLKSAEPDPHDREGYLGDARRRLGKADERIYTYLAAANKNFLDRSELSGLVMLGVSAELLMKWLIGRFIDHLPDHKQADFEKTRSDLWMRTDKLFTTFIGAFATHYSELAPDLQYQADANLDLLQTLIRVNRDDVGHGRPDRADPTMLHGYLLSYLTLLRLARELADAFEATPCAVYGK